MTRFPLRYAHQNILVGHGEARAALFRVETVSYPFLAAADKLKWLRRLARFAFSVEADFSLYRVCRAYPAERYTEQAERDVQTARAFSRRRPGAPICTRTRSTCASCARSRPRSTSRSRCRASGRRASYAAAIACGAAWKRSSASASEVPIRGGGDRDAARGRRSRFLGVSRRVFPSGGRRRGSCSGCCGELPAVALPNRGINDHWEPAALVVDTGDGQLGYQPLGTDLVLSCQRADPRARPRPGRRRRGGSQPSGDVRDGCAARGVGVSGRCGVAVLSVGRARVPGRRRAARALAAQPGGDHAGQTADRGPPTSPTPSS